MRTSPQTVSIRGTIVFPTGSGGDRIGGVDLAYRSAEPANEEQR
jgi:hypothetical protein